MYDSIKKSASKFFKDKNGNLVIWQQPNLPLYGWLVSKLISVFVSQNNVKTGFRHLSNAFLFTWAILELTKGASYFRRLIGFIVLAFLIVRYFYI